MKKYKTQVHQELVDHWIDSYSAYTKSPSKWLWEAYDDIKAFIEAYKDKDARFYLYITSMRNNGSNSSSWRLYVTYKRQVEEWVTVEEIDYFTPQDYDEWKYVCLAMFDEVLWLIDTSLIEWDIVFNKFLFDRCNAEDLEKRKMNLDKSIRDDTSQTDVQSD